MKTLKYALKNEWYIFLLLLIPFLAIPFLWHQLPAQIATHFDLQGQANGYSSKTFGLFFIPFLSVGLYLLFLYLPKIDPKKRITVDQKPMPVVRLIIVLILFGVHSSIILNALGYEMGSPNWTLAVIALSFVLMGNYMRTIQPNYFIGIRVPWTLEDPQNWRQTHQMASYLWVAGGLLLLILFPLLSTNLYFYFFMIIAVAISLLPCIYSFYLYKTQS